MSTPASASTSTAFLAVDGSEGCITFWMGLRPAFNHPTLLVAARKCMSRGSWWFRLACVQSPNTLGCGQEVHELRLAVKEKKLPLIAEFWESVMSSEKRKMGTISERTTLLEEHATTKRKHGQNEPRTPENQEGEPSSGMVLRRKKKVNYTESSSSADSDGYVEEHKNKNARSHVRDNSSFRESTPCPTTRSVTHTLKVTPNKPIITKATYEEYSAHIICAFNTTIHLVKETIGEQLENIFQLEYFEIFEIESKIISETKIEDNQTTEEDRFIFFIRYALLDFVSMFKYLMPKVLDRDMLERSYIIECLSPILRAFRNAFPDVKYMWIEKDVRLIKEANNIFMSNIGERKTDLLILRSSDARELLNDEVSGPPYRSTKKHTRGTCTRYWYDIVVERIKGAEAHQDLGKKASRRSDITIKDEDELEVLSTLGLVYETSLADQGKQTEKALTKDQATSPIPDNSTCNRATSPIVIEDISNTPENSGNQANEIMRGLKSANSEGQTNDVTKTRSSRQSSPKIDREQDKLQGLLQELSTSIK
ncbi:1053_t:CDS:10, partial [Acaulospora morrowiae]